MLLRTRIIILLSLVLFSLFSCKPGVPNGILSEGEMEDILYDYHIAKGLASQKTSDSLSYYTRYYHKKVFEKYNIDEAHFDSSMVWYSRHTERLSNIYKNLSERMGNTSSIITGNKILASGEATPGGDTLNIWPLPHTIMIHSKGKNFAIFKEKTDTVIQPGDNLLWKFKTDWYYNEGIKQAMAVLVARFKNDSTATSVRQLYESSSSMELSLYIGNDTVKEVEGFIYQMAPWTKHPRIISVSEIQLLRIKRKPIKAIDEESMPLMRSTTNVMSVQ